MPLPLQRCLMGFRDGADLFLYVLHQCTKVIRQKSFVYGFNGGSSGTCLEVRHIVIKGVLSCF